MLRADSLSAEHEYDINLKLYEEYRKYILDSAVRYVERNLEIARELKSSRKIYQSLLQLAPLYSFSGRYIDSQAVLKSIDPSQLPEEMLSRYYEVCIQFYDHYGLASSNKYHDIKPGRFSMPPDCRTMKLRQRRNDVWYFSRSIRPYSEGDISPPASDGCTSE